MNIYKRLGIRTVINGNATLTRLGGSIMPPEVVAAMADAAKHFVDIIDLQKRVGEEIAKLTHNEAAYVSCGAAAALTLSTAACITGLDAAKREKITPLSRAPGRCGFQPHTGPLSREVRFPTAHNEKRNHCPSPRARRIRLRRTPSRCHIRRDRQRHRHSSRRIRKRHHRENRRHLLLRQPLIENTSGSPYEEAIAIAKRHDVPLIVDAAAQLPPPESLWRFTQMGADLALFSGGKGLCGPQSSGLIVGKKSLIDAIAFNGPPHPFIGRGMKVGKEEKWSGYLPQWNGI